MTECSGSCTTLASTDAIDTVKNLYEDATTQVRLPLGEALKKFQLKEAPSS